MNVANKLVLSSIVLALYMVPVANAATTGATEDPRSITNSPVNPPSSDATVDPRSITNSPVKNTANKKILERENGESKNVDVKSNENYNNPVDKDYRSSINNTSILLAEANTKKTVDDFNKRDNSMNRAENVTNSDSRTTNKKIENHQERVLDKNDPNKRNNAGDTQSGVPTDNNVPSPHQGEVLKNKPHEPATKSYD